MTKSTINRRTAIQMIGVAAGASVVKPVKADSPKATNTAFIFSLNMATIRGQKLGFMKELETAAKAGYHSVEIWADTLNEYLATGGSLKEVRTRLHDLGLQVENCISFDQWTVDDEPTRKAAMESMKKQMGMMAEIGCKRIAATGKGLPPDPTMSLDTFAERYHKVLELGASMHVLPILELWGFQKKLSKLDEVVYIAMQTGNKSANILLDIFHLYRGKTSLDTMSFINPDIVDILHMNDYPSTLSPDVITDADRIYPGDGVAPIKRILKMLKRHDKPLILSAELFNAGYYKQDALTVAKTTLEKMKRVVESPY
jgi:2-keto-myo-inositol isomerase